MGFQQLLTEAKEIENRSPMFYNTYTSFNVFKTGARWMHQMLVELGGIENIPFNANVNYTCYGISKYGLCLLFFMSSFYFLYLMHPILSVLSIWIFYFIEVHFLFLFPLLITGNKSPFKNSISLTYRMGIFKTALTVIPIGFYMVAGLLDVKRPLRKWHIGCLTILIWYKNEIRNRI